jgi:hypothetical protein
MAADVTVTATVTAPPAMRAPEDACPVTEPDPALEINDGMPHVAHLASLEDDYGLSCHTFSTSPDAVFRLTLTAPADVVVTAVPSASTTTYVSFRNSPCAIAGSQRTCLSTFGTVGVRTVQHSLPAGTYWLVVEESTAGDVTVTAQITSPPAPIVNYVLGSPPAGTTFVDVCAAGVEHRTALPSADESTVLLPHTTGSPIITIPFPLRMYNVNITPPLTVSSNGWMAAIPSGTSSVAFGSLPAPALPNMTIAPLWNDLVLGTTGVCYAVLGTEPNRSFVVEWQDAHPFLLTGHITFEAILYEAPAGQNNVIDMIYQSADGVESDTIGGIESDDGTLGTVVPGPFTAPRMVRFTPM